MVASSHNPARRTEAASDTPRFAGHTIDEMLTALRRAATNEAIGLEALETLAARGEQQIVKTTIEDVRRHGIALGAAHALLMQLEPHEAVFARLLKETTI